MDAAPALLTVLVMVAFASNSLLTRAALGTGAIDAATFTAIRLAAGAAVLVPLARARTGTWTSAWRCGTIGPAMLVAYALPFSFAYVRIGAAVGALVLFPAVQLTMIGYGLARGERPSAASWAGIALALAGLAMLTLPSVTRPDAIGCMLMASAGVAWAAYSIAGRQSGDPVAANAASFLWGGLLCVMLAATRRTDMGATAHGVALAAISGAVTSGLGYALWYRVLPRLSVTQAAASQLSVPIIAALGAAVVLGERLTPTLMVSGAATVLGVGLVLRARPVPRPSDGRPGTRV